MPYRVRSNQFEIVTAILVIIEVGLIGALSYSVGVSHTERQLSAEGYTAQYSESPDDRIATACAGRQGASLVECVRQEVETAHEHRRSEYDLSAQQDMADYAFWLVWISVATVAVTAMGVWFVKRTLDATFAAVEDTSAATDAMREANSIMRQEQRPWVRIEFEPDLRVTPKGLSLEIKCYIFNFGGRPAMIGRCEFSRCVDHNTFEQRADIAAKAYAGRRVPSGQAGLWPLFPGEKVRITSVAVDVNGHSSPLVEIESLVFYTESTGGEWMHNLATHEFLVAPRSGLMSLLDVQTEDDFTYTKFPREMGTHKIK